MRNIQNIIIDTFRITERLFRVHGISSPLLDPARHGLSLKT